MRSSTLLLILWSAGAVAQNLNPTPMPCEKITNSTFYNPLLDYYKESNCFVFDKQSSQFIQIYTHRNIEVKASEEILMDEEVILSASTPLGNNPDGILLHIAPIDHEIAWFEPTGTPFQVGRFEKLELGISLSEEIRHKIQNFVDDLTVPASDKINPYLEWEIKLEAEFYKNGVLKKTVDGFYYEEFERGVDGWNKLGESYTYQNDIAFNFRVRAALPEVGDWTCKMKVILPNETILLREVDFEVVESQNNGFVKVGTNKRYFTKGGETFFFVGQNVLWPEISGQCENDAGNMRLNCENSPKPDYNCGITEFHPDVYTNFYDGINELSENVNFIRTMMVPFTWDFEFEALGDYSDRMYIAWEMDRFFELCHDKDMYVNWSLAWGEEFHNPNSNAPSWDWFEHGYPGEQLFAYKQAFNLTDPIEYFDHPGVRDYYEQKLRYFVARYGYSTNLSIIEVQNEGNTREGYNQGTGQTAIRSWHQFVTSYLKYNLDIDQLTCVNYANGYDTGTGELSIIDNSFRLPSVDVASYNFYPDHSPDSYRDQFFLFNRKYMGSNINAWYYDLNKPVIIGETAGGSFEQCSPVVRESYDNALLCSMMGFAGVIVWDTNSIDLPRKKLLQEFMNEIDLDGDNFQPYVFQPEKQNDNQSKKAMTRDDETVQFFHLRSATSPHKAVGVLHNRTYNFYSMRDQFYDDNTGSDLIDPPADLYWRNKGYACANISEDFPCDNLKGKKRSDGAFEGIFELSPFRFPSTIISENSDRLELRDLSSGWYLTDFYSAFDFTYISSSLDNGAKKELSFSMMSQNRRLLMFKSRPIGSTFMTPQEVGEYALAVEKEIVFRAESFDSNTTLVGEVDQVDIRVNPNPVRVGAPIIIAIDESLSDVSCAVYNQLGMKIKDVGNLSNGKTIDMEEAGTYVLVFHRDEQLIKRIKLVVL